MLELQFASAGCWVLRPHLNLSPRGYCNALQRVDSCGHADWAGLCWRVLWLQMRHRIIHAVLNDLRSERQNGIASAISSDVYA